MISILNSLTCVAELQCTYSVVKQYNEVIRFTGYVRVTKTVKLISLFLNCIHQTRYIAL